MNETCLSVFQIAEGIKSGGRFSIPPLQRGLVWNAARMEALWDSILRGIPIGAISIRNNEIFDGQQRTHAISVGLNGGCSKEDEEILWLDLSPNGKKRVRKFYFRTTTLAHPWGYQLNDDEANNHLLEHGEQRDAVEWLRNNGYEWQLKDDVVEKPYPFEFWPWTARLPVPFAVVVNFINEENGDNTWKHFHEFIQEKYSSKNWGRFFLAVNEKVKIDPKYWECIVSAIQRLSQYRVPIVNADTIYDPDDEALYFKRMNVNGKEPETEDVQYSMLKWHLPSLKKLDEMASGFKSPAVLAQLAMLYFKNTKKERKRSEYVTTVSDGSIADFAADKDFAKFIDQELAELMRGADKLLKIGASDGLLPWHRTRMCQRCWQLYMYLMKASVNPEKGIDYAGLALLIRLFANDAKSVVKTLWTSKSVREALQTSLWEGTLRTPIYPEELAYLNSEEIISGRNWFENVLRWSKTEIGQRWNALRKGFDHNGAVVEMLGYSCRKFMSKMFHGYDASDPRWLEQNRPWDYDHVLPKAWIHRRCRSGWSFTPICQHTLWSIGNSAPVPYSYNRSKNANPPGENYPLGTNEEPLEMGNGLLLDVDAVADYTRDTYWFDDSRNERKIKAFVKTTAKRSWRVYSDMFETLGMRELLNLRLFDPARNEILFRVANMLGGELYVVNNGRRILLKEDVTDWEYLQRFVKKIQLSVAIGRFCVCYETDELDGLVGWIGIRCGNDTLEKDHSLQKSVEQVLDEEHEWFVNDPEWYAYCDVEGMDEAAITSKMREYIDKTRAISAGNNINVGK